MSRLLRTMHARARDLGIGEDARRDLIERETGQRSAKGLSDAQLRKVIGAMRAGDSLPAHPMAGKLRALWISGWHLGVVRDRSDRALCRYVAQALGLDAARWAASRMPAAVEEVKRLLAREGGVDWSPVKVAWADRPNELRDAPRVRVLEAQWRKLQEAGIADIPEALGHYVCRCLGLSQRSLLDISDEQLDEAIRILGSKIRKAQRHG